MVGGGGVGIAVGGIRRRIVARGGSGGEGQWWWKSWAVVISLIPQPSALP